MENLQLVENSLKKYLQDLFSIEAYNDYFASLKIDSFNANNGYLVLSVDTELEKTTLINIAKSLIEQYVTTNFNTYCLISDIVVKDVTSNDQVQNASFNFQDDNLDYLESNLMIEYSFDNFIPGNNNTLYQLGKKIAETEDNMFCNPLFISGPSGVGKSHISHAIGNSYQMNFPDKRVRYISSDKFTSDFIFTIQGNDPVEQKKFKDYFKSIDLLIFDDIQNLIGKTRTIDEFFVILNNLINMRKRIIIISDRDFEELRDFPSRIITRISSGFTYSMNKPDYESRIAILKMKASIQHLDDIPDEVYEFISSSLDNNVRELEGALNTLFYSSMFENEGEIDLPFTIKILGSKYKRSKFTKLNYSSIKNLVSETMSVKVEDLSSKKRTKQIALSRKIAIYLARELLEDSFSRIAKEFNLKDHTSSKYNYDQMIQILKKDSAIVTIVENIRKKLTS